MGARQYTRRDYDFTFIPSLVPQMRTASGMLGLIFVDLILT